MAEKRLQFQCWNCNREYSLLREIHKNTKLLVACPYCSEEAVVDLTPYHEQAAMNVFKSASADGETEVGELNLPDVLPTEKRPAEDNDS